MKIGDIFGQRSPIGHRTTISDLSVYGFFFCTQASLLLLTMIKDRLLIDVTDHRLVTSGNLGC